MTSVVIETLPEFFFPRVRDAFYEENIPRVELVAYVTGVLNDFVRARRMYAPLGRAGQEEWQTQYIYDMMNAARALDRTAQRIIYQHVGDFTLFMLGLFPEYVRRKGTETLYFDSGEMSYRNVSNLIPDLAELFSGLSRYFVQCVYALNMMSERHLHFADSDIHPEIRRFIDSIKSIDSI